MIFLVKSLNHLALKPIIHIWRIMGDITKNQKKVKK